MKIYVESVRSAISRMFPSWRKMGHIINKKPSGSDIQLSSVKIKSKNKLPVVLRLDGVYYDKADNYIRKNNVISKSHNIADAVVYQSNLSKKMCEKYLSKRKTKTFKIIYNGINPSGWNNYKKHDGINIVSCSKWRAPKRLNEIIQLFIKFLKYYPTAKLHIIGPMMRGARVIKNPNIIYYGNVNYSKIRDIYSEMDIYIHLCKKDSCPSSVIEAIASGIPVITTNACGGATEVCRLTDGCVIINGESESLEPDFIYKDHYNKLPLKVENRILKTMVKIVNNKTRVVLPDVLGIENVAKQYLEVMKLLIN